MEGFLCLNPPSYHHHHHPSENSSSASYFAINVLAFDTPFPLIIFNDLPWGGYGYFVEPHNTVWFQKQALGWGGGGGEWGGLDWTKKNHA